VKVTPQLSPNTQIPRTRYWTQNRIIYELDQLFGTKKDVVMGNCTSLFNASSGKANIQDPVKNHPAKPLSTDVPIQNGRLDPPPKPEGVDPVLEENIRKGLRLLMKKSSDRENSNIILPEELARFWTTAKCRFYNRQSWYDPKWDEEDEMTKFQTIISVLVLARFNNWGNFRRVFIDEQERLDENLPFKSEDLKNENFLGPDFAPNFYDCQWIFCPLVIEERQEPYELLGMEAERRFPYIKPGKEIGSGATGVVSKQVIAARHLKYSALGRKSDNTEVCEIFVCFSIWYTNASIEQDYCM
jgi:hypothetical protein